MGAAEGDLEHVKQEKEDEEKHHRKAGNVERKGWGWSWKKMSPFGRLVGRFALCRRS